MAGKVFEKDKVGPWVRPIGNQSHAISEAECLCSDKRGLRHLDIVTIEFSKAIPDAHQIENHQIAPNAEWTKTHYFLVSYIDMLVDDPTSLWKNTSQSKNGKNDRVTADEIPKCGRSLYLVRPDEFAIVVDCPWEKNRVRGQFKYKGLEYNLAITDPFIEDEYRVKALGSYSIDPVPMCVSLAEQNPRDGFYYKVVASLLIKGNHS